MESQAIQKKLQQLFSLCLFFSFFLILVVVANFTFIQNIHRHRRRCRIEFGTTNIMVFTINKYKYTFFQLLYLFCIFFSVWPIDNI